MLSAGVGLSRAPGPLPRHGAVGRGLVAEVPVHGVQQLHGLLVSPDGVQHHGEEGEARVEKGARDEGVDGVDGRPVAPGDPPHVVGEHHAAVEHVDHHPLVGPPEHAAGPAGLAKGRGRRGV